MANELDRREAYRMLHLLAEAGYLPKPGKDVAVDAKGDEGEYTYEVTYHTPGEDFGRPYVEIDILGPGGGFCCTLRETPYRLALSRWREQQLRDALRVDREELYRLREEVTALRESRPPANPPAGA